MKKYLAPNYLLPFYLADQLALNINSYNLCFSYTLDHFSEVQLLIEKLQQLVKLKSYLRQTFIMEDNKLIGRIHRNLPAEVHFFKSLSDDLAILEKTLIKKSPDFKAESPIRLNIIKVIDTNKFIALFNIHHILMDGVSVELFITDLNRLIAGDELSEISSTEYLSEVGKVRSLENSENCPDIDNYVKSIEEIEDEMSGFSQYKKSEVLHDCHLLPESIKEKLTETSKQEDISTFNLLLLAWSAFIAKLTNQKRILVNYPVNIRRERLISGCFVNTVIFPFTLRDHDSYSTLVASLVKQLPLLKRVAKYQINSTTEKSGLINFTNSNFTKVIDLIINDKVFNSKSYDQIGNSYISVKYKVDENGKFLFSNDILAKIYPDCVTDSFLPRFFNFLKKLLDNYNTKISTIDLTFEDELKKVSYLFNQTQCEFPSNKTLVDLFEEQVEKTPNNIALVFGELKYTYADLNIRANQLAHYLMNDHQVKPNDLIALLLERNQHMLIAILAVLKTGGAYVPLDINNPQERIRYILEDTQVKMVLINKAHKNIIQSIDYLENKEFDTISIDNFLIQEEIKKQNKFNIITADISTNLAYVIYTSGTTGKPKGVMIEHISVVNTLYSLLSVYKRDGARPSKITAFTSYAFDVSVSEFFVALIQGDELHLLNDTLRHDIIAISRYINNQKINYLYLPPVLLAQFPRIKYPTLRAIIYAGEPCDAETASYWSKKTKLYNYYGPTETCIYATGTQIQSDEVSLIGKPINNTQAYILDSNRLFQPIGIVGELYIGGQGLAKGYLHNRDLTEERFIKNPFQSEEETQNTHNRLYKTGDLARWNIEGNIEYLGRNDFQVKIRGYRIELGEIESALINFPDIKQAVVIPMEIVDKSNASISTHLVGYYVSNKKLDERAIRDFLKLFLPDFMHPSILIYLKSLPVTPNGKLDRNELPKPEFLSHIGYIAPTNNKETIICDTFSKILNIEKIGIEDDFFNLGGTSILAIKLVLSLQANFDIKVSDIYTLRTPKKIAKEILFTKDNLKKNLVNIKNYYQHKLANPFNINIFQKKFDDYLQSIVDLEVDFGKASITNILLTGATGFLGCHLLHTLLTVTDYSIFLIVRADSDEDAYERVGHKYDFYFNENLASVYNTRLFVYAGNIEKRDLGICDENYETLVQQIDSIIHAAALTKHYGNYDTFYLANVQATNNLLELCIKTKLKQFHYISTKSVLNENGLPNSYYMFTEEDLGDNLPERSNTYVRTKYESEKIVIKYRKNGVNSNIYRIGNLAFALNSQKGQENIEDNGFFTRLQCVLDLKIVAEEISNEEISPVDLTAQAIVKLFDKNHTINRIYHVFSPHTCDWGKMLTEINYLSINKFISVIIENLNNPNFQQTIELFLLHQRWLNEQFIDTNRFCVLQDKTNTILKKLGFEWVPVSKEVFNKYLKMEIERDKKSRYS